MTVLINLLFVLVIISYSIYVLVRHFKKAKQGHCRACDMDGHCDTSSLPKHLQK
ncbi:FeoB-associated Cys-rich membrane protein [Staphylococcus ratti]|uniref:FeoB-associated Cys-rich membrane protein n=1 Tax=Staphylococcus ratti TaxID=2892440 RepID=A0ABY3PC08_9STAP|nr:FeoB-associated Cys-rich membrane protein [Staphylococcus ratti]UEX89835.1 FeoB-associated Cys-rich membrane protein [Staphylococcus ratti]